MFSKNKLKAKNDNEITINQKETEDKKKLCKEETNFFLSFDAIFFLWENLVLNWIKKFIVFFWCFDV